MWSKREVEEGLYRDCHGWLYFSRRMWDKWLDGILMNIHKCIRNMNVLMVMWIKLMKMILINVNNHCVTILMQHIMYEYENDDKC